MRRDTRWIGYVTAVFGALYAALGVGWAFGMPGFPFGVGDAELVAGGDAAFGLSVLGTATPQVTGIGVAIVGVAVAALCTAMTRRVGPRKFLIGAGIVLAVGLTVVIQDFRPLILIAYTPILLISKPLFDWPTNAGFAELFSWPRVNLLLLLLAGTAVAATTWRYVRDTADGCGECGRPPIDSKRLARIGRIAVTVAVVVPLLYSATRWAWAMGFPLGLNAEAFAEGQREGLWLAGAALASLGAGGAILTLGLVQRWGEVFPRWMIGLAGRRVPPMLAVVPATLVSVLVTAAGFMYIRLVTVNGVSVKDLAAMLPETVWPLWGGALLVATIAYWWRRTACPVCDSGHAVSGKAPQEAESH